MTPHRCSLSRSPRKPLRLLWLAGALIAATPRLGVAVPVFPPSTAGPRDAEDVLACPLHWRPGDPAALFPHPAAPQVESVGLADASGGAALRAARGWVEVGQPGRALALLDSAAVAAPEARLYRLAALAALEHWEDFGAALAAAGGAAVPAGCGPLVDRWRASAAMAGGRPEEAERAYARLVAALEPIAGYVAVWRLEDAATAGDLSRGEAAWDEIEAGGLPRPARVDARALLPLLYERGGRLDEAKRRHLDLAAAARGAERAAHWLAAAGIAEAAGDRSEADRLRRRVLESEPASAAGLVLDPELRERLEVEAVEAAEVLLAASRAAEAEPYATAAVESASGVERRKEALRLRSRIRIAAGDAAGADADLDAYLAAWPDDPRAPGIHYDRARLAFRRGDGAAGRSRLHAFLERYPSHPQATAALYLLADSYQDDRHLDPTFAGRALALFDRLTRNHPGSTFADRAYMRAAHLTYALDRLEEAERRYAAYRGGESRREARYWLARTLERRGSRARAEELYRTLAQGYDDYYALVSRARLPGGKAAPPLLGGGYRPGPAAPDGAGVSLQAEPAGRAAALLLAMGERRWARAELERAVAALRETERLARWAPALVAWGFPDLTLSIGLRLGAATPTGERYLHPRGFAASIDAEARAHGLDAAYVLALIRQESMYRIDAVSPVGARGLLQIMPATGREIAAETEWSHYDPAVLFEPAVALHFGAHYMAAQVERFDGFWPAVLAAYNGGPHNVARWWLFPERTLDPELWIDRIPYKETREYVRKVVAQRAAYDRLYGASSAGAR